ncbi:sulfate ABC transporter, inner membrane subunit CysW [Chondrocystis sp. NIES-4102]|nr:sulfate ABC transporter, inner membrane subunit CysW [Chondrocystis sp. NIES-4102]
MLTKKDNRLQYILIAIALSYLALLLVVPAIAIFYEAFHQGIQVFITEINKREFWQAVKLTLIATAIAVPINTVFGLCAAWLIARNRFRGRTLLLSIIDLPFSISPVVAGLMLILLYGDNGWLGGLFKTLDIKIIFALPGIVLATAFVTLPFVAREVIPILEEIGSEQETAARTLGANDWQVFTRITLPSIRWGLLYGILLTNARAMGEFGAVSVVSGSILGKTATLPIFVEQAYKNYQAEAAFGAAAILALLGIFTLILQELLQKKSY